MDRRHLNQEKVKFLINGVDDLQLKGLAKGALSTEETVEEVAESDNLPLRGQGSGNDP